MKYKVGDEFIGKHHRYILTIIAIEYKEYKFHMTRENGTVTTLKTSESILEEYCRKLSKLDKVLK